MYVTFKFDIPDNIKKKGRRFYKASSGKESADIDDLLDFKMEQIDAYIEFEGAVYKAVKTIREV